MQPAPETVYIEAQPQVVTVPLVQPGVVVIPTTAAGTAMIMACISLVICGPLLSIPALIMAMQAENITKQYPGHPDTGTATNAKIISIVSLCFSVVLIFWFTTGTNM